MIMRHEVVKHLISSHRQLDESRLAESHHETVTLQGIIYDFSCEHPSRVSWGFIKLCYYHVVD